MTRCKICGVEFTGETDSVVMCKYHSGNVHLGCCMDCCSWHGKPCEHVIGVFERV